MAVDGKRDSGGQFIPSPLRIAVGAQPRPLVDLAVEAVRRDLKDRCGIEVTHAATGDSAHLILEVRPDIGTEGFVIEDGPHGQVQIIGNDERGLLYGVGRFLRASRFEEDAFTPGRWRGRSVPQKPVRGIYFATHFHNFYHDAPVLNVQRYVDEMALWGLNALTVWFDMHHFSGIDDPHAQKMIERLRALFQAGKAAGMRVGLGLLANEAYATSPKKLRADPHTGRAHYGVELCPNMPGARQLMLRWFDEEFGAFCDIGVDHIWIWPYDQGGCACAKCRPWGAKGLLMMAEVIAELYRKRFPEGKVILSTWLFDYAQDEGEWRGLAKAFARKPSWLDYVLADSHDRFPEYPLAHGSPGGLPLLGFPEISMWQMWPWGGYGANPGPQRFQERWDAARKHLSGGFPYSEGIFEDINKAILSQFYWNEDTRAEDTVREYIAYEYSPEVVDEVAKAIGILEKNHPRHLARDAKGAIKLAKLEAGLGQGLFEFERQDAGAEESYDLLSSADKRLPPRARTSWRWRILLLRGLIDRDLRRNNGMPTPQCEEAFRELAATYHAGGAEASVAPPSREAILRLRPRR